MDVMFVDAKYHADISLNDKALSYFKKYKVIALYAAVQYAHSLKEIIAQLEKNGNTVITSQPERTSSPYQILGCDLSFKNLKLPKKPDAFLYIGDGLFHPKALILSQIYENEFIDVIVYDPIDQEHAVLGIDIVKKELKKYKGSIMKFLASDIIGVLITTKPGQEQMRPSFQLKEKYPNKEFYFFVENAVSFNAFENFPFIEAWVNTACPRLGFDDSQHITAPLLNLNDALHAEEILSNQIILHGVK